ncbi:MAG TPA: ATP-dependent sacrificial sulfur transferase LarE [Actinomycetota bacterium]|nr:ATP-dependent sacrificial sulfur transferase LarE [Actinomycetota bacterium]
MVAIAISVKLDELQRTLGELGGAVVAFSGGVDSSVVTAAAARALGDRALAVTAVSPSLPPGELDGARRLAARIGVRHLVVATREAEREGYLANGDDRCYHCKDELYTVLSGIAAQGGYAWVASGTNVDDLGDHRPGLVAAREHSVRHPLVEAEMTKRDVRVVARELGLPVWDKPASACLSSRIAFGRRITVGELTRVGRAERLLKDLGFRQVRVRVHGDLARVEVELPDLPRLAEHGVRDRVVDGLKDLGYRYVTVDLEGFRSGSMNPES